MSERETERVRMWSVDGEGGYVRLRRDGDRVMLEAGWKGEGMAAVWLGLDIARAVAREMEVVSR